MNIEMCVNSLNMPLPEDILKRKWAGDLSGAIRAIDLKLEGELPELLRARLVCECERIRRLPTQYPWNRDKALEKLSELVGKPVTDEQLEELELRGWVDYLYIEGEKRYFVRFHRSMKHGGALDHLIEEKKSAYNDFLDPMVDEMIEKGELARRITIGASLYIGKEDFEPDTYLAHMPFPAVCAQQRDVQLLSGDPDGIAAQDAPARVLWWKRDLKEWQSFDATYSYVSHVRYADPLGRPAPEKTLYDCPPPCAEDLAERGAYLRFTPYLRQLAGQLTAGESSNLMKAWRIYEFVTTKITYSFMRDYFQFDNHGEYCAVNLKGDCGLQALLFIILCRISGIPARWQSGLAVEPDYTGGHDWAQFYLEGWGWLFADPSYGGSAFRAGSAKRHKFYFGNLDPMRMVANRVYQAQLEPKKQQLRWDPFDNQSGEIEREHAALPFTGRQIDCDLNMLDCQNL